MTEGEKFDRLLKKHRIQDVQFAVHAGGVSKTAVGKWHKRKEFSAVTWKKIKLGLQYYELDPAEIRAERHERPGHYDELTRKVVDWSDDQVAHLRRILLTPPDKTEMIALMAYINGRLQKSQNVK